MKLRKKWLAASLSLATFAVAGCDNGLGCPGTAIPNPQTCADGKTMWILSSTNGTTSCVAYDYQDAAGISQKVCTFNAGGDTETFASCEAAALLLVCPTS